MVVDLLSTYVCSLLMPQESARHVKASNPDHALMQLSVASTSPHEPHLFLATTSERSFDLQIIAHDVSFVSGSSRTAHQLLLDPTYSA